MKGSLVGIGFLVLGIGGAPRLDRVRGQGVTVDERFLVGAADRAHVLARSSSGGSRLLIAFPAGNLAAALWFEGDDGGEAPMIRLEEAEIRRRPTPDGDRHEVFVRFELPPRAFRVTRTLFHNIRFVRGYTEGSPVRDREQVSRAKALIATLPPEVRSRLEARSLGIEALEAWERTLPAVRPDPADPAVWLTFSRPALGTGTPLRLTVGVHGARGTLDPDRGVRLEPTGAGPVRIQVLAHHRLDPAPMLAAADVLSDRGREALERLRGLDQEAATRVDEAVRGIAFLTSADGMRAGSWRFLTYFGRDTLLFSMLMGPYLSARGWEIAMGSVLDRLAPDGRVAHEESVDEHGAFSRLGTFVRLWPRDRQAALETLTTLETQPLAVLDYHMVDTEAMVPIGLAQMFRFHPEAARSLAASRSDALRRVLGLDLARARRATGPEPDAGSPVPSGEIRILQGLAVGDWRDSQEGLGGGVHPGSVNACLMPAAVEALGYLATGSRVAPDVLPLPAGEIEALRRAWRAVSERYGFSYRVDRMDSLPSYLEASGLAGVPVIPPAGNPPERSALALARDASGRLVTVLHGDGLFLLLAPTPPPVDLARALSPLFDPFPFGLDTPAGPLVASAATDPTVRHLFTRSHYHGLVVWSWPMVLARLAPGILESWDRPELAARMRRTTEGWGLPRVEPEELWGITIEGGRPARTPFGGRASDSTESNSLQLWSLASLAPVLAAAERP